MTDSLDIPTELIAPTQADDKPAIPVNVPISSEFPFLMNKKTREIFPYLPELAAHTKDLIGVYDLTGSTTPVSEETLQEQFNDISSSAPKENGYSIEFPNTVEHPNDEFNSADSQLILMRLDEIATEQERQSLLLQAILEAVKDKGLDIVPMGEVGPKLLSPINVEPNTTVDSAPKAPVAPVDSAPKAPVAPVNDGTTDITTAPKQKSSGNKGRKVEV